MYGDRINFFVTDSITTIGGNSYKIVESFEDGSTIRYKNYMGLLPDNYFAKYQILSTDSIYKYYKKTCKLNDNWMEDIFNGTLHFTVVDTSRINVWGRLLSAVKLKITDFGLIIVYQIWTDSIGLLQEINEEGQWMILRGCVINGVAYGDTTTLAVKDDFNSHKNYMLLQNYPNPFNSMTKIFFYLPFGSDVSLKVYNLFGEEVKTLVNEYRPSGHYTELFNGEDLSSGVYFYVLNANSLIKIKKMILLK